MTIREVEEALNVTRANVRFYEKEGLIAPKRNPLNDYRDYSREDVEALKRILYLRSLEVPIGKIRVLMLDEEKLCDVLRERKRELEMQGRQTQEALLLCEKLLGGEWSFDDFPMEESGGQNRSVLLKDTLTRLWMFWDKLVVWGFLALQLFYTIIVFPLLPERIPVTWDGCVAVEYKVRAVFLLYFVFSLLLMLAARQTLYICLVGGLRCYLDELSAILTVGAIGYGFSVEIYTVLFLQGISVGIDAFQVGCIACYLLVVILIVLIYRHHKKRAAA